MAKISHPHRFRQKLYHEPGFMEWIASNLNMLNPSGDSEKQGCANDSYRCARAREPLKLTAKDGSCGFLISNTGKSEVIELFLA
jgi:hypothetical protein